MVYYPFILNDNERESVRVFINKHCETCHELAYKTEKRCGDGGFDCGFSYIFSPNEIGIVIIIKCNKCTSQEDMTDYDCW